MRLFIFSLDDDAMDWFIDLPANKDKRKIKTQENENDKDLIKGLTQIIKDMQLNQVQLIKSMEVNHA